MADDANPPSETPEIRDPMSLRDTDTSRLKRIKPQTSLRVANVDGSTEVGSETVHLKVIKEKKKQLAGILSASQTIRLRPSGGEASPAGPAPAGEAPRPGTLKLRAPGANDPSTSKVSRAHRSPSELVAGEEKRPTLKLRAPGAGAAPTQAAPAAGGANPTLKLSAPSAGAPATQAAPAGAGSGRATLKLKAPGEQKLKTHSLPRVNQSSAAAPAAQSEAETSALSKSTLKLRAPSPAAQTQQAPAAGSPGTLKLRAPGAPAADGGSKATLKLRAPGSPPSDTGQAPASPGTLKLKAPASAPTIQAPSPGGAGETVKQEAPKPGKTLKLRTTPSTGGTAEPSSAPAQQPAQQVAYAPVGTEPGILYTLGAVASLGIMGFACYLTISQYMELFQIR